MFRAVLTVSLVLAAGPAFTQSNDFSKTVGLDAGGSLRVVGSKGSIHITSWDQPQVEIHARIVRPEGVDDDYAKRAVEATKIDVTGGGQSLTVKTNYDQVPTRHGWGHGHGDRSVPPVHYEIRAPHRIQLSVDSDRGPATIAGFEGSFDIVADRGELELRDLAGDVRVEIDRGDHSRINGVRGSLRLDSDRTDLLIDAQAIDRNSSIEIDRGDLELRVPEQQRLTVRTDISRRGDFRSDFAIQWMGSNPRQSEGHINGGGTELYVEGDRGNINLRRR
jgi:hypothetical protein